MILLIYGILTFVIHFLNENTPTKKDLLYSHFLTIGKNNLEKDFTMSKIYILKMKRR